MTVEDRRVLKVIHERTELDSLMSWDSYVYLLNILNLSILIHLLTCEKVDAKKTVMT